MEQNPDHLESIQQCIRSLEKQCQKGNEEQETEVEDGNETEQEEEGREYEMMTKIEVPDNLEELLTEMTAEYNQLRTKLLLVQKQRNITMAS